MNPYKEKKVFLDKNGQGMVYFHSYSKVIVTLHNGEMNTNNYISITITEHINTHSYGITRVADTVENLLAYISSKGLPYDKLEILEYVRELEEKAERICNGIINK